MYALGGGAIQESVRFLKHHKNYILPYNGFHRHGGWVLQAHLPQARHLTGRIDKRHNFGDPATVEWQRGDTSQG
jgi:hypothetical protein